MPEGGLPGPARHVGTAITEESHHSVAVLLVAGVQLHSTGQSKSGVTAVGCQLFLTGDPGLAERGHSDRKILSARWSDIAFRAGSLCRIQLTQ